MSIDLRYFVRANAYGRQIEANGWFATLSVNEEEFSHGGTEMDENQIGTIIVDCAVQLQKDGITRIINGHL